MLAKIRSDGDIALATASSGIAATLLDEDTTAHSRFKIPIDIQSDSTYNIPAQSHLAELIRETKLVFRDETSMQHRNTFEMMDRIFKDIRNDRRSFGDVMFCFCEDFRQILPVVPRGIHGQIVSASLKCSSFWHHIQRLSLIINMRLLFAANVARRTIASRGICQSYSHNRRRLRYHQRDHSVIVKRNCP